MQNYELTKHPAIYSQTYWGNFDADKNKTQQRLIDNRNQFVIDYNIKRCLLNGRRPMCVSRYLNRLASGPHRALYDHVEVYEARDRAIIVIMSPYGDHGIVDGFSQIYDLYASDSAKTYLLLATKADMWASVKKHKDYYAPRRLM